MGVGAAVGLVVSRALQGRGRRGGLLVTRQGAVDGAAAAHTRGHGAGRRVANARGAHAGAARDHVVGVEVRVGLRRHAAHTVDVGRREARRQRG